MFNNPFHRVVAEAKDEREQLDRLLRISAPHERIVLTAAVLVILAFAAWLLFGTIVRSVTVEGVLIEPGERHMAVSTEPGQLLEYLVAPGDRVEAGQPVARQSVPELDREAAALRDRVTLLHSEFGRAGGGDALHSLLVSSRAALLAMEARRAARQTIVSRSAGKVMALSFVPGKFLAAGSAVAQIRVDADRPLQAVLRVDRKVAQRIRPGMRSSVEVAMPNGETLDIEGAVARTAAGPLPDWLAALMPAKPESSHRIDIVLGDEAAFSVPDGTACRIRIELGRHSPAGLFAPRRS